MDRVEDAACVRRRPRRSGPKQEKVEIEVEIVYTDTPLSPARKAAGERFMTALAARLLGDQPTRG